MCLAVPGQLISLAGEGVLKSGRVKFGGVVKEVNLGCVPEAVIGDYVLVHVGMAISIVDEEEAHRVFEYLKVIDDLDELRAGEAI